MHTRRSAGDMAMPEMEALHEQSAELPAMTLRVHGGGGLAASLAATGETAIPPGLEGLDSHVLDAACRARLSPEEKLEREVIRRRELELERRQRIFDAKRRTIGVDKEALDAQVAEKERRLEQEKKNNHTGSNYMLALDRQLKIQEAAKKQVRHEMEKECREFSKQQLAKHQADTFDLNDPHTLRKSQPMRVGDNDPRCGPASMLKFGGEDLMKDERVRQQQKQQVMFIEQQKFEKAMLAEENNEEKIAQETREMIELRNEMEANENALRRELQKNQQDANLQKVGELAAVRREKIQQEADRDMAELYHHAQDPFLNERTQQINSNGKIRRAEYKGSTREERLQGRMMLEQQAAEQQMTKNDGKEDDYMMSQFQEATRRKLIMQERAKQRDKRLVAMQNAQENIKLRAEKEQKTKALNDLYTNRFSDDFFEQFGIGTR